MITIPIKNKELNVSKIQNWIVEDEHDLEEFKFVLQEDGDYDLSYYLIYRNNENKGGFERLAKETDGTTVSLIWSPTHNFTQVKGKIKIQIIGILCIEENNEYYVAKRWSTISNSIVISENIEPDTIAPDVSSDMLEQYIAQIEADIATYSQIKEDMDEGIEEFDAKYMDFNEKYDDFSAKYEDVKDRMITADLYKDEHDQYSILAFGGVVLHD